MMVIRRRARENRHRLGSHNPDYEPVNHLENESTKLRSPVNWVEVSSIDSERLFLPVISNTNSLGEVCISASESKESMQYSSISNSPLALDIRSLCEEPKLTASVCGRVSAESVVLNHRLISLWQKY